MNICTNVILLQCSKAEVWTLSNQNFPPISYYAYGIKKTCTILTQYISKIFKYFTLFAAIVVFTPHPCVFHRLNFRDIELKYSRYESMSFDYIINNIAFNMIRLSVY